MAPKVLPSIFILIATATVCLCQLRPNIIFILTDDQDIALGGLTPMTKTRNYFKENGLFFENAFTHIPICCPSRSSILTGRYQHNHQVLNNTVEGNCYGDQWRNISEHVTFAKYLHDTNYTTFYAGKYLNNYATYGPIPDRYQAPPGWNVWNGLVGNSVYYNYSLSVNGVPEVHGFAPEDYLTDVIHDRALEFLKSNSTKSQQPFFMMLSTPAPHYPFTPSNKYIGMFSNVTAPRTPNYEMTGGPTKHWLLRQTPEKFTNETIQYIDQDYRDRWATLLSVDDIVADVVSTLQEQGLINNTYLFFSSDHGYHFGQFGLPREKMQMYEFDIRVPFMVSGPGIAPGLIRKEPVVSIDLAPTFLELAGAQFDNSTMDGMSLVPLLRSRTENLTSDWRTSFLVEYRGQGTIGPMDNCPQYGNNSELSSCYVDCICDDARNNSFSCLRWLEVGTRDTIYCSFDDSEAFVEAYDLQADPYQMNNIADKLGSLFKTFIRLLLKTLIKTN